VMAEVADLHAEPASREQGLGRSSGRVPRHVPAHEVAVAAALVVGPLAERREGHVARMQVGQLTDLAVEEGAALALGFGGLVRVPHEEVRDQLASPLEYLQ